jgi:DNA replication protein DnaC
MDNQNQVLDGIMKNLIDDNNPSGSRTGILRVNRLECPVHGLYSSLVIGYMSEDGQEVVVEEDKRCHHCVREQEENERQRIAYEQYKAKRISGLTAENGVTGIFEDVRYGSFIVDPLQDAGKQHVWGMVMAWVSGSFRNLILSGKPGTGKTLLASIAVNEACRNMRSAFYVTEQKLYRTFRAVLQYPEREGQLVKQFAAFDFLAIDELGRSAGTEYEARLLAEILDDRYKLSKATMLCTNMSQEELTAYLGDNVIRRIAASGRRAKCDWAPFRGAQG